MCARQALLHAEAIAPLVDDFGRDCRRARQHAAVTAVIDSEQCDDEDTFVGRCYTLKALLWARGVVACGWAKPLQLLSLVGMCPGRSVKGILPPADDTATATASWLHGHCNLKLG